MSARLQAAVARATIDALKEYPVVNSSFFLDEKKAGKVALGAFYARRALRIMPIYYAALLAAFGYWAVALYLVFMALITITAVVLATETFQDDINVDQEQERQLIRER